LFKIRNTIIEEALWSMHQGGGIREEASGEGIKGEASRGEASGRMHQGGGIKEEAPLERQPRGSMEEASWTRRHGGGTKEEKSWRRHTGCIRETSGRNLGEASGRHQGGCILDASIWETSGNHQRSIWEASGRHPP